MPFACRTYTFYNKPQRYRAISTLLCFVFIFLNTGIAQRLVFNEVLPPGGPFSHITGIEQDSNGYMWFATKAGLYSYNGYEMHAYKSDQFDPNALSSNLIETITIDKHNHVWVGTLGSGVDRLDPQTGMFHHYRHDPEDDQSISSDYVTTVFADHQGILWIGSGRGLDRYDPERDTFIHFQTIAGDASSLSSNEVVGLFEDSEGTLWVGTGSVYSASRDDPDDGGLNRLDRESGTFTRFKHEPDNSNSLINNKVRTIFESSNGTLWIGTAGDGLHSMDKATGIITRLQYDHAHPHALSRPPLHTEFTATDHIAFINEDAHGGIWIGTTESGLNYYDPEQRMTTHYIQEVERDNGLYDRALWSAHVSLEGVVWIGTMTGHLYRVDPGRKVITHVPLQDGVFGFYEDPKGTLWIAGKDLFTSDGAYSDLTSQINNQIDIFTDSWHFIPSISAARDGGLWIGTTGGLFHVEKDLRSFTHFRHDRDDPNSISTNPVVTIEEGPEGRVWVATLRGLNMLDTETGKFTRHFLLEDDTGPFGQNMVLDLLLDTRDRLWVGLASGAGLNLFDRTTNTFINYLQVLEAKCVYEDASGTIWVGANDGLYRYDAATDKYYRFSDPNSFVEFSDIRMIVEDDRNYLWVGMSAGLVSINPGRTEVQIYGSNYGIGEHGLNLHASARGRDGRLYFGTDGGYYMFHPSELETPVVSPKILITGFYTSDEEAHTTNLLETELSKSNEIHLKHNQNTFSIDFVGIDYHDPGQNHHFYRLENFDQIWHPANPDRKAYYFNIPPGKYAFAVKAVNSYGIWAEKRQSIIISPPWWQTWWAYLLYGLFFIASALAIYRIQKARVIRKERERSRERELAQAREIEKAYAELKATQTQLIQSEKMASLGELTAGIAHEIQNPLNFVNNFSEVNNELIEELKSERQKAKGERQEEIEKALLDDIIQNLEKISFHGKRADGIVKSMLQHSRASTGQKELTDINALADEYLRLAYHGYRAKDKSFNVKFETDFDSSLPKLNVVPQDIGRVLLNLINNAFYACMERQNGGPTSRKASSVEDGQRLTVNGEMPEAYQPIVTVGTKNLGDKIEIRVEDNGMGIPDEIKDKIFQPFFTTKPTGQGTGLGLSLSYDIIKAHGGDLKVETLPAEVIAQEGKGGEFTKFIVQLPV